MTGRDDPEPVKALDRDAVVRAIRPLLPEIARRVDTVRVVGTASSVLRGIAIPAGDVDILIRSRAGVDELATIADRAGAARVSPPTVLENPVFTQYFAAAMISGVRVEISTVEAAPDFAAEVGECTGDTPWTCFDLVAVDGHAVPVVASELRLLTEITRDRPDRWVPIGRHLARTGYDADRLAAVAQALPATLRTTLSDALRADETAGLCFAVVDPRSAGAREALLRYLVEVEARLGGAGTGPADADAVDDFVAPTGAFVVALEAATGRVRACGAIRRFDATTGEIKRMWVEPELRGRRIGSAMLAELERVGRTLGYRAVRLDTNETLTDAIRLYETAGFARIDRFNDNPNASHFFEKQLARTAEEEHP